jgi:putative redox protein
MRANDSDSLARSLTVFTHQQFQNSRVILFLKLRRRATMAGNNGKSTIYFAGNDLFVGITPSGHGQAIETNSTRNNAATPMELLLLALGGCTGVDVISILKKKRQHVTDYRIEVSGERREEHPRAYTRLEVRHIVRGRRVSEQAVAQAIELSETKYCSVAATLRGSAEIISSFEIVEDENENATE